ncbi:MAG TPA: tetratricopeptide repeat protein [Bacteroidales bacterium]|nr:tetratricopeptide repeat protein [Bacteroidales bacterium]
MVKKTDKTEEKITAVEQALSKSEMFIEQNRKILSIIVLVIVLVIVAFFVARRFLIDVRSEEAKSLIYKAEQYFEMDSLRLALEGDGVYPGFLEIISEYRWTKPARLSHYYAGVIYLRQGEYEEAKRHLRRFRGDDFIVKNMAIAGIGDAYWGLGEPAKAAKYYLKAARRNQNDFTTPVFLMRAALCFEELNEWQKAIDIYERIRQEHFNTQEGREAERHIAFAKEMLINQ